MRISDWSSDVCSSDLPEQRHHSKNAQQRRYMDRDDEHQQRNDDGPGHALPRMEAHRRPCGGRTAGVMNGVGDAEQPWPMQQAMGPVKPAIVKHEIKHDRSRSEEHTSELQSLMRISYAVFCLKKKNTHQTAAQTYTTTQKEKT